MKFSFIETNRKNFELKIMTRVLSVSQHAYFAWKLALVLRGQAGERLLETYFEERHPNAVALVNTTDRIFSGFISSGQGWAGFVRRWVLPAVVPPLMRVKRVRSRAFDILSQTRLTYRGRSLSVGDSGGKLKPGDRFPWFMHAGRDVFAHLSPSRFTLFALGDWSAHKTGLEALRSPLLEVVGITDHASLYETGLTDGLYLVRPDGYIGLITHEPGEVRAYLTQTLGLSAARETVRA